MKEIKFRVWDQVNKVMHYDIMVRAAAWNTILSDGGTAMQFTGLRDLAANEIWEGDILSVPDESYESISGEIGGPMEPFNHLAPVIYLDDCGSFGIHVKDRGYYFNRENVSFSRMLYDMGSDFISKEVKVIGNIFENTELLKNE